MIGPIPVLDLLIDMLMLVGLTALFWKKKGVDQQDHNGWTTIEEPTTTRAKVTTAQAELIDYCLDNGLSLIINSDGIFIEREKDHD